MSVYLGVFATATIVRGACVLAPSGRFGRDTHFPRIGRTWCGKGGGLMWTLVTACRLLRGRRFFFFFEWYCMIIAT